MDRALAPELLPRGMGRGVSGGHGKNWALYRHREFLSLLPSMASGPQGTDLKSSEITLDTTGRGSEPLPEGRRQLMGPRSGLHMTEREVRLMGKQRSAVPLWRRPR